MKKTLARSQAGVLAVIHKCWRPVISAWMPKSSVQGWQTLRHNICPCIHWQKTKAWQVALNQLFAQPTGYRPWPGFRHPCRNDGFFGLAGLVYNARAKGRGRTKLVENRPKR